MTDDRKPDETALTTPSVALDAPPLSAKEQRRKAGQLLNLLQWTLVLSMLAIMLWLYVSQQRFEQEINDRLQNQEQINTRLNEMDDRLHAINPLTVPAERLPDGNQAQNQLELLRIQFQAVNPLLADSNDEAAVALLRGLLWQISQDNNDIAPALTIVLKQSLKQDIEYLQARSRQPNGWQLHNLAIVDIQKFLHEYLGHIEHSARLSEDAAYSQRSSDEAMIVHETLMTLNLAMQASNMRDKTLLQLYLQQAKDQLSTLNDSRSQRPASSGNGQLRDNDAAPAIDETHDHDASAPISAHGINTPLHTVSDSLIWLDKLLAAPPQRPTLVTTQVLEDAQAQSQSQ